MSAAIGGFIVGLGVASIIWANLLIGLDQGYRQQLKGMCKRIGRECGESEES